MHDDERWLRDRLGVASPSGVAVAQAIGRRTEQAYERWLAPLYEAHWPTASARARWKIRFLACRLYAGSVWTARLVLSAPLEAEDFVAQRAVDHEAYHILAAAFVAGVDHVLDRELGALSPEARVSAVEGALRGEPFGGSEPLAWLGALFFELVRAAPPEASFDRARGLLAAWLSAEADALAEREDPSGMEHRLPGIEGTVAGLAVGLGASEALEQWMRDCSLFVQILDDWIDRDDDRREGRRTPALTGKWVADDVRVGWQRTLDGLEKLVAGRPDAVVVVDTYRAQMNEVLVAMLGGGAA